MFEHSVFKTATLAASIALAMGSTAVMAATPVATQLPGVGALVSGAGTSATAGTISAGEQSIAIGGHAVIDWGKAGGTINAAGGSGGAQPAGFNIGSDAKLHFTGSAADAVLNLDSSGNPSQILGTLDDGTTGTGIFVANANGIVVGANAKISSTGVVGLVANTLGATTGFDGTVASLVYNGTGGDVTVAKDASISGTSVLVSGGGTVNVDLGKIIGTVDLLAGLPSNIAYDVPNNSFTTTGGFSAINANAALNLTGVLPTGSTFKGGAALVSPGIYTVGGLVSGGDITSSGIVDASNAATVAAGGTLTNKGDFTWGLHGSMTPGNVANNGTMNLTGSIDLGGSLSNHGEITGPANVILSHGLNNVGSIAAALIQSQGDFTNSGMMTTGAAGASLLTYPAGVTVIGGDFSNSGELNSLGGVSVTNGSLSNRGQLTVGNSDVGGAGPNVLTTSDDTLSSFSKTGAYFIDNTGTITSAAGLTLSANAQTTANGSTGSITNSGILQLAPNSTLMLLANNGVNLAGTVQAGSGTTYKALSATNSLNDLGIFAAGSSTGGPGLKTVGVATVATDIVTANHTSVVVGNQVKLMSNLSALDATGAPVGAFMILAGASPDTDYAVRVASGKTVTAAAISVNGDKAGDEPNTIIQGMLAAQDIAFGDINPVSDVYTGPAGSLSLSKITTNPTLKFNFTGGVKTVPYNNTPSNFRYNGLNVVTDGSPLALTLNPTAYTTNGTSNGKSAVNILVNSDVSLGSTSLPVAPVAGGGTAVTGVTNTPNTHLVLQSSGNIDTTSGDFYWPGYVYLGTVDKDADGNALPGTLSADGEITLTGNFNNVLPGDVAGASGIHFMSGNPLVAPAGTKVTTNANAWINFPTDLLTQSYAQGLIGNPTFFGGTAAGLVVTYGALDAESFHTHPVDASK